MEVYKIKAKIVDNLLDTIEQYFGEGAGHRTDEEFLALAERIEGKIVTLKMQGSPEYGFDSFEEEDNDYWLPDCCWNKVEEE